MRYAIGFLLFVSLATAEEARVGNIIDLGVPQHSFYYSAGISKLDTRATPGGLLLLQYNYETNFTFYDVAAYSYAIPAEEAEEAEYFALLRFRKRQRFFEWPFLYDWSTYSFKTNTAENLNGRAILETGYGATLLQPKGADGKAEWSIESGIVFDYASLDAYTQNVATGYFKAATILNWRFGAWGGETLFHYYFEIVNPTSESDSFADQSRYELESNLGYSFSANMTLTAGLLMTHFSKISKLFKERTFGKLVEQSATYYLVFTYHHGL